jgi:hypothetical protein
MPPPITSKPVKQRKVCFNMINNKVTCTMATCIHCLFSMPSSDRLISFSEQPTVILKNLLLHCSTSSTLAGMATECFLKANWLLVKQHRDRKFATAVHDRSSHPGSKFLILVPGLLFECNIWTHEIPCFSTGTSLTDSISFIQSLSCGLLWSTPTRYAKPCNML